MASSPLTAVPLLLAAFFLAACNGEAPPEAEQAPKPQPSRAAPTETAPPEDSAILLEPVGFAALPGWEQDRLGAALPALNRSCARLTAQPAARPLGPDGLAGTVGDWRAPCAALQGLAEDDDAGTRAALEEYFRPFAVSNAGQREGLFTGYYEAELKAAASPAAPGATPLYRVPDDLVTADLALFRADLRGTKLIGQIRDGRLVPYLTRAEIDGLCGRASRRGQRHAIRARKKQRERKKQPEQDTHRCKHEILPASGMGSSIYLPATQPHPDDCADRSPHNGGRDRSL